MLSAPSYLDNDSNHLSAEKIMSDNGITAVRFS